MLENTVWKQYNKENNFKEKLAEHCVMSIREFIEDDKILYGVMKSKLTKKELKLFAMDSASVPEEEIMKDFEWDKEALAKAKYKLYKKFKQDKTRLSFRTQSKLFLST